MNRLIILIVMLLSLATPCLAQGCDPAKFLKYDDVKFSQDLALQLSYLNSLSQADTNNVNSSGGFKYGDASLNANQTRQVSSSLNKQLKIDFSNKENTWYTISKLSETGKDAYLGCLKDSTDNFQLKVAGDPMGSDQFFVYIKSTPKVDLPRVQKVSASVIGGKVLEADKSIISTQQAQLRLSRDLSKETTISVKVGPFYQSIDLPPVPNTVAFQTRSSEGKYDDQYGGQGHKQHTLCVELPNDEQDAIIVPDTLKLSTDLVEANMGSVDMQKPDYSPRKTCALVVWHLGSSDGRVRGTAKVYAEVAKVVPSFTVVQIHTTTHKRKIRR